MNNCIVCNSTLGFRCSKFCSKACRFKHYGKKVTHDKSKDWLSIKLKEKGLRYD